MEGDCSVVALNETVQVAVCRLSIDKAVLRMNLPVTLIHALAKGVVASADVDDVRSGAIQVQAFPRLVVRVGHAKLTEDAVSIGIEKAAIERITP